MPELPDFDPRKYEDMREFGVIPAGEYPMQIVKSERKPTKKQTGDMLVLEMEVIQGDHKGRRLWVNLNLWNRNQDACEIASRELATISRAVGFDGPPGESEKLHRIPFIGKVKVKPASGQYKEGNELKGYKSYKAEGAISSSAASSVPSPGVKNPIPNFLKAEKTNTAPFDKKKTSSESAEPEEEVPV